MCAVRCPPVLKSEGKRWMRKWKGCVRSGDGKKWDGKEVVTVKVVMKTHLSTTVPSN